VSDDLSGNENGSDDVSDDLSGNENGSDDVSDDVSGNENGNAMKSENDGEIRVYPNLYPRQA
jgi:hypothetical protein